MQAITRCTIDIEDLALEMGEDQAFNAIKIIDQAQEDWSFTLKVCDYFKQLEKEYYQMEE